MNRNADLAWKLISELPMPIGYHMELNAVTGNIMVRGPTKAFVVTQKFVDDTLTPGVTEGGFKLAVREMIKKLVEVENSEVSRPAGPRYCALQDYLVEAERREEFYKLVVTDATMLDSQPWIRRISGPHWLTFVDPKEE